MSAGTTIASLVLLSAVATVAGWLWLKQQQTRQREAFQALAARRGWSLTITEQKLGRPAILRLTARSGRGWHCESQAPAGSDTGRSAYLTTEFTAADPHWPEGYLVLGPGPSAGTDLESTAVMVPKGKSSLTMADRIGQALPDGVKAQLDGYLSVPGLTVQATCDPLQRFDMAELAKLMSGWQMQQANIDGQPVLHIGPEGFRLQVGHGMRRADQMETFIDFALAIIRVI